MKWSEIYLKTLREKPASGETQGHILLLRGGYIFPISSGIFIYNTFLLRSIKKLSAIVREELEKEGAREILMPMVQPKNLWEETGRWEKFEGLLMKMKSHSQQEFCLGPTHEEVVTAFVRSGISSYRDMPFNIYQIQTKYRDEIRPRFGLMRAREFIMKDAYSFDRDEKSAIESYQKMFRAYSQIFQRLKVPFAVVQADAGLIGGDKSEEFHILADRGEDVLLVSDKSDFSANRDVCPALPHSDKGSKEEEGSVEKFETPGIKTIEGLARYLKCKEESLVKILFIKIFLNKKEKSVAILCRGSDSISLLKVQKALGSEREPQLLSHAEVKQISGASIGSCGPVGLSCPIYMDHKLKTVKNFITGANEDGFHLKNVNLKDFQVEAFNDCCYAKAGDPSPDGQGVLKEKRGIEVGHLFYLSDTYSQSMGLQYQDKNGKNQFVKMGCYGIGITRTLQAVVEQNYDKNGIVWPVSIAPFLIHICLLDLESEKVLKVLNELEVFFKKENIDYFIDDRKERPGVKFKDADLIGLPFRINLGEKDLKNLQIELVVRKTNQKEKIQINEISKIKKYIKEG